MKTKCSEIWEGIVALAEGRIDPSAEDHLKTCAACSEKLAQIQRILGGLRVSAYAAPVEAVDKAKAIFPNRREVRTAIRLSSTLASAGARSTATDNFQVLYQSEDVQARLLYRREGDDWEVTGRINEGKWQAEAAGRKIKIESDGRFHFLVKSLRESEMRLLGTEYDILIPSGEEARAGGA